VSRFDTMLGSPRGAEPVELSKAGGGFRLTRTQDSGRPRRMQCKHGNVPVYFFLDALQWLHASAARWRFEGSALGRGMADAVL